MVELNNELAQLEEKNAALEEKLAVATMQSEKIRQAPLGGPAA
jgi:hypothetical protein